MSQTANVAMVDREIMRRGCVEADGDQTCAKAVWAKGRSTQSGRARSTTETETL